VAKCNKIKGNLNIFGNILGADKCVHDATASVVVQQQQRIKRKEIITHAGKVTRKKKINKIKAETQQPRAL
jgi:hypothetical protein